MAWELSDKETEAVLKLDGPARYEYFVKKAADEERVWSLWQQDGWALASDDDGRELVPVWPHENYASLCASGAWVGFLPRAIELETWIERWLPGMERDGRRVAVFPIPGGQGESVESNRALADLKAELTNY